MHILDAQQNFSSLLSWKSMAGDSHVVLRGDYNQPRHTTFNLDLGSRHPPPFNLFHHSHQPIFNKLIWVKSLHILDLATKPFSYFALTRKQGGRKRQLPASWKWKHDLNVCEMRRDTWQCAWAAWRVIWVKTCRMQMRNKMFLFEFVVVKSKETDISSKRKLDLGSGPKGSNRLGRGTRRLQNLGWYFG